MRNLFSAALSVAVVLAAGGAAFAGVEEEQARAVLDQHKTAVVTIQLVIKQKFSMGGRGSQENESRNEVTGTVISPEGLAVVALSATDPTSIYKTMMPDGMDDVQIDSEVSDVKILLGDGTEVPAQVVLRDNDLDLAYVRPLAKPAAPMAFVDLADSAPAQLLDTLVSINRLGKVAGRVYSVSLERVEAIVEKPRRFYIPGNDPTSTNQGCPAFTLDGKVVGLFVIRTIKDTSGSGGRGMFSGNENVIPVLLPAEDILEGARQAPESAPARSAGGEASEEAAPATGGTEQ